MHNHVSSRHHTFFRILIVIVSVAAVIAATVYVAANYLASVSEQKQRGCERMGVKHTVVIKSNLVTPAHIDAKKCDTLEIVNQDTSKRLMAFGRHDQHVVYDGMTTRQLGTNQSLVVELNKSGSYRFHDHYDDNVAGTFTVSR